MAGKLKHFAVVCALAALLVAVSGTTQANWFETFDGEQLDLPAWQFHVFPEATKTFTHTIKTESNGNKYLSLDETVSYNLDGGSYGSGFGMGFGSNEEFTDVRVGAVVNVTGDASRNYCGLGARTTYIIDDGSLTQLPGSLVVLATYLMHINWEEGPANLSIDIEKVVMMENIMRNEEDLGLELHVPGLDHARSYYAEMDILGSDPVYLTGSLYEYKGGPLVARTATMVDTNGNDPWEEDEGSNAPFLSGSSGIFAQHEHNLRLEEPPGYHCTFDDVFSVSDGPAAVNPSPADGATGVSVNAALSWIEAAFATGREVWLGTPGAMKKIATPTGKTYTAGPLEFGQTYQWRVDQVGPSGIVTGHTWTFTTAECLAIEDFQLYGNDADLRAAWVDNIEEVGIEYVLLAADTAGNKTMRFEFQNQYPPYFTEATRTFATPQDWTQLGAEALSLAFVGDDSNVEHPMYLKVEDAAGHSAKVEHPFTYACESELWQDWTIALANFSTGGVDLTRVKKFTIGLGDGQDSGQAAEDKDGIYIDDIKLCPARCFNPQQLDLRGDLNGDCRVDIEDLLILMDNWLNDGLSAVP